VEFFYRRKFSNTWRTPRCPKLMKTTLPFKSDILNIAFVILKIKMITSVLSEELTDEISALKRPVNINCLMRKDFASKAE
jgi:hypothetical protein